LETGTIFHVRRREEQVGGTKRGEGKKVGGWRKKETGKKKVEIKEYNSKIYC